MRGYPLWLVFSCTDTLCINLKATQMNVQRTLIWKLMRYELELSHKAAEAIKNICWEKGKYVVDYSNQNFRSGFKNLNDQARSDEPKSGDSEAMFQSIVTNYSSPRRVSGELTISKSRVIHHLHELGKNIRGCQKLCFMLPKYCKTFGSLVCISTCILDLELRRYQLRQ